MYADDIVLPGTGTRDSLTELGSRVLQDVIRWSAGATIGSRPPRHLLCPLFERPPRDGEKRPSHTYQPCRQELSLQGRDAHFRGRVRQPGVLQTRRSPQGKGGAHGRENRRTRANARGSLTQKTSLYRNVFLPGVMYASPVWWDQLRPDCHLSSSVVSIQRAALLGLLGAYHTTRTTALQVLLNAPPIKLERANAEYGQTQADFLRRGFVPPGQNLTILIQHKCNVNRKENPTETDRK